MPDLLLELRSEEIPARMQRKAAGDLKKLVTDALIEAGLTYEAAKEYWTPRRLTLDIRGLDARSKPVREEVKGPATTAPEQAVQGFLRKAGLSSVDQAQVQTDPKKGSFYVAVSEKPGREAGDIVASVMPGIVRSFPWPKSMRWGKASREPGSLRWVRPLQSILCVIGPETGETEVVDFSVDGVRAGNMTVGHRFHAPGEIAVRRFDDYVAKLEKAHVILDAERRKAMIHADAKTLAFANGLELVEDDGLLEEVSGLVEWPVVLIGEFEERFLDIPGEIIRLTIKANQKCFVTRPFPRSSGPSGHLLPQGEKDPRQPSPLVGSEGRAEASDSAPGGGSPRSGQTGGGKLAPRFLLVSNISAKDGGVDIARGNGKVVRARLSDAVHFWKTDQADLPDLSAQADSAKKFDLDLKKPLDQRMARLDHLGVTFHAKLGTQGERVARIAKLAGEIAAVLSTSPLWGSEGRVEARDSTPGAEGAGGGNIATPTPSLRSDPPHKGEGDLGLLARRAAVLAKADLQTEVVGEFPELQGAMGKKYAELQGEHPSVAVAIEDHYKPVGPTDRVPTDPVAISVALADKLDTLVGFWAIDEKPTGSKDPYALRRAALGVIRILLENGVRVGLVSIALPLFLTAFRNEQDRNLAAMHTRLRQLELEWEAARSLPFAFGVQRGAAAEGVVIGQKNTIREFEERARNEIATLASKATSDLLSFFHDRLKVWLKDKGVRHDLIDAVLAPPSTSPLWGGRAEGAGGGNAATPTPTLRSDPPLKGEGDLGASRNDDLVLVARKVEALAAFVDTEEGKNLVAGWKRANNILIAEEKKGAEIARILDARLFKEPAETALFEAMNAATNTAGHAVDREDFSGAMKALASLRGPVDAFLDTVLVNDPDADIRINRLTLLNELRRATARVADFSKLSG